MALENYLRENPLARKLFGKKEIDIIARQLRGVPLGPSERVRLSRDIRPKLELVKELKDYEDEFSLGKNQSNARLRDKAVAAIRKDRLGRKAIAILLFGSQATGGQTLDSDIDLAVIFQIRPSRQAAFDFKARMNGLSDRVQVVIFNELPPKVKREISRFHRVLFESGFDEADLLSRSLAEASDCEITARTACRLAIA